ncbi:MAG TPA: DUF4249 family protein, partial [Bacteroidetes bacterium]|nr:DUF4249 family protein [Bacteroidota bacterium]
MKKHWKHKTITHPGKIKIDMTYKKILYQFRSGLRKNKPLLHRHILKTKCLRKTKFPNHFVLSIFSAALIFIFSACIDELNIETDEAQRLLVVEGFIDTNPGPHRIKLSRSAK